MKRGLILTVAICGTLMAATAVQAAVVTMTIEQTGPNSFQVLATTDAPAGIASVSAFLSGADTFTHNLPEAGFWPLIGSAAGFQNGNNESDWVGGASSNVFAGQNLLSPASWLFGVGVTPGAFTGGAFGTVIGDPWAAPVIVGTGTFLDAVPSWDRAAGGSALIFSSENRVQGNPDPADIVLVDVPEPASVALIGLGGLALLRRRK